MVNGHITKEMTLVALGLKRWEREERKSMM